MVKVVQISSLDSAKDVENKINKNISDGLTIEYVTSKFVVFSDRKLTEKKFEKKKNEANKS